MPVSLVLYTTSACHLCEQAEVLLRSLRERGVAFRLEKRDIADDDVLMERYGVRIPVVRRRDTGEELGWPFDEAQVAEFLREE